ncbi:MAG: hypothetical protein DMF60_05695 [Acidobacteria bacterium]|nr:MAG: hypothetical protein DMF60_05695 [Acidobacteriota bacterium]
MKALEVFFDPFNLFGRLNARPNWLIPFLIVALAGVVSIFLMSPVVMHVAVQQIPEGASAETQEQMLSMFKVWRYYGILISPLLLIIRWSISAFLLFSVSVLFGADITYRKVLSLLANASIIIALDNLLSIGVLYLRGVDTIKSMEDIQSTVLSLNHIFGSPGHPVMRVFLESINVLTVWYMIVLVLGMASLTKVSKKQSAVIVGLVWAMQTMFVIGLAMIFSHVGSVAA